jgi:hypothetical protein
MRLFTLLHYKKDISLKKIGYFIRHIYRLFSDPFILNDQFFFLFNGHISDHIIDQLHKTIRI